MIRQLEWSWMREQVLGNTRSEAEALEVGIADLESFMREVGGDRIGPLRRERGGLVVTLQAGDGERYHLRIVPEHYPNRAPSCTFVDEQGELEPTAWPKHDGRGPFRPPEFICTPPTAEFYRYHRERSYDPREGTLVNLVSTIFAALHGPGYAGRYDLGRSRRA